MRLLRTLLLFALPVLSGAANRALLVGVGVYGNPQIPNLPGINHDIEVNSAALRVLGFQETDMRILMDSRATLANIRTEIQSWLGSAGANDRVVFYFSGHGSLSLDAGNKEVGVLVPYGVSIANGRLLNALSGPDLAAMVAGIPSRHVLIIADACHSGHMTDAAKGLGLVPKFLQYPGMPTGLSGLSTSKGIVQDTGVNHLLFAACRREEIAGATPNGSVFTLALKASVDRLLSEQQPVTMATVQKLILALLQDKGQHPELSGAGDLSSANWAGGGNAPPPPPGPSPQQPAADWLLIQDLYQRRSGELTVHASKPIYRNGDTMTLEVELPSEGYVNIIAMGARDSSGTVLFPNQYAPDNRVKAGKLVIPNAPGYELSQEISGGGFEENELVVIFTAREVNFYRDSPGKDVFRKLSKAARDRGTVVRESKDYRAGFATYRIAPSR